MSSHLEGREAGAGLAGQLAAELAGLGGAVPLCLGALAGLQPVRQADGARALLHTHGYNNQEEQYHYPATDPLEADELLVAHRLVGLEAAGRALHGAPVAVAVAAAPVVLAAQRAHVEAAVAVAARTLHSQSEVSTAAT